MKPEEALGFVERVRGEVASRSDGERAAEALRIVLAMATAAEGMKAALDAVETGGGNYQDFGSCPDCGQLPKDGHSLTCKVSLALNAYREATK